MRLLGGGMLLLLLLLLPVPPAYTGDYCTTWCISGRSLEFVYKHGREPYTFVCKEYFDPAGPSYAKCIKGILEDCNDVHGVWYTKINETSFQCKAYGPAVKLDCLDRCEDRRRKPGPYSFECTLLGLKVDCTKCEEECEYKCSFNSSVQSHVIHCDEPREKTEKPVTATTAVPVGEPMTPPAPTPGTPKVTTTSGSPQVEEQKTEGDDDDNSTVYIIVGVVVGLLLLVVAGGVAYYFYRKWKMRRQVGEAQPASEAIEPSVEESVSSVSSSSQRPVKAVGKA